MANPQTERKGTTRRGIIATSLMFGGIAAGYGLGAVHFFRYLVPLRKKADAREMFIGTLADFPVGESRTIADPRGEKIAVLRAFDDPKDPAKGFKALSTKCPHLGCRVHWEPGPGHFLCPCHNGIFDKEGVALSGPPAKEGKNLSTFEIKVDPQSGWVYVMIAEEPRYGA